MVRLIEAFSKMPGVGIRTAERFAFYILGAPREDVESLSELVKKAKENNDFEALKTSSQNLSDSLQKIGEMLYKDAAGKNQEKSDNVKEAEFEEKKEDGEKN